MAMPYKKAIDAPWVIEVITEGFDGALELMTEGSIIYGGAVRDALAGMPLEGDLDIAVSRNNSNTQKRMFSESLKWKEASVNKKSPFAQTAPNYKSYTGDYHHRVISADSLEQYGLTYLTTSRAATAGLNRVYRNAASDAPTLFSVMVAPQKYVNVDDSAIKLVRDLNGVFYHDPNGKVAKMLHKKYSEGGDSVPSWGNPYAKYRKSDSPGSRYGKSVPMSAVSNFEGIGGIKAQIIVAKTTGNRRNKHVFNKDEEVLRVVREVDMICCGVAMNTEGEVFELVAGAYEDCQNKILRVNPVILTPDLEIPVLEERINRLTARGWESKIDLKPLSGKIQKMKSSAEKKAKVKFERQQARMSAKKKKKDKEGKESLLDYSKSVLDELFEKKAKEGIWHTYIMDDASLVTANGSDDILWLRDKVNKKLPGCIKKVVSMRPGGTKNETHFYVENDRLERPDKIYIFGPAHNELIYVGISDSIPKPKQHKTREYTKSTKPAIYGWDKISINMPTKKSKKKTQNKTNLVTNYGASLSRAEILNNWEGIDVAFRIIKKRIDNLGIPSLQAVKQVQLGKIHIKCAGPADITLLDGLKTRPTLGEIQSSGADTNMSYPSTKPSAYAQASIEPEIPSGGDLYTNYNHIYTPGDIRHLFSNSRDICIAAVTQRCTPYGIDVNFEKLPAGGVMCRLSRSRAFDTRTIDAIFKTEPHQTKVRSDGDEEGPATLARKMSWSAGNELRVKSRVTGRTSSSHSNLEHVDTVKEMHKATLKAKYGNTFKTSFSDIEKKILATGEWYGKNTPEGVTYMEQEVSKSLIEEWGGLSAFTTGVRAIARNNGITFSLEATSSTGADVSFERPERPMSNSLIRKILTPPAYNNNRRNKTMKVNSDTEE